MDRGRNMAKGRPFGYGTRKMPSLAFKVFKMRGAAAMGSRERSSLARRVPSS